MNFGTIFEYITKYLLPIVGYFFPNRPYPVEPLSYNLRIINYFGADNNNVDKIDESTRHLQDHIDGQLKIEIRCNEKNVSFITLDADETKLFIRSEDISLKDKHGKPVDIKSSQFTEEQNKYKIEFHSSLRKRQRYYLEIPHFTVSFKEYHVGYSLYPVYKGRDKRNLSATCASEMYMNRIIPHFGYPDIKVPFEITIGHQEQYTAVSNMPLRDTNPMLEKDGWVLSHFQKSPPMPANLVAFVVGELELVKVKFLSQDNTSKDLNIYSKKEKREMMLAVNYGLASLKYFENYFKKAYPLTKLDLIGIDGYPLHVLEHPGSILFLEINFFGNESSSLEIKESAVTMIFSAVAHQWFGIGVTFNRLTDGFWLGESVCLYLSIEAVKKEYPDLNDMDISLMHYLHLAINEDSNLSAVPIIKKDENLKSFRDEITTNKGVSLIRMLSLIFKKDFKKAIQNFVKRYSQTKADDFYKELDHFKGLRLFGKVSVKHLVDSYTYQPGVPIVEVQREKNSVILTQKRYVRSSEPLITDRDLFDDSGDQFTENMPEREVATSGTAEDAHRSEAITERIWLIPIDLRTSSKRTIKTILCSSEMVISDITANEQIILNYEVLGYYVTKYDKTSLEQLMQAIKTNYKQFPITNVYEFIRTSLNFANDGLDGYNDYSFVFQLFKFVFDKEEYLLWLAIFEDIELILNNLKYSNFLNQIQNYFAENIHFMYARIIGENLNKMPATYEEWKLLSYMSILANNVRLSAFEEAARNLFQQWKNPVAPKGNFEIASHVRSSIFCSALRNSSTPADDFNLIWKYYLKMRTGISSDSETLLSLGCVRNSELRKRFLQVSIDTNIYLEPHDRVEIFRHFLNGLSDPVARFEIAQNFFKENFEAIKHMLESRDCLHLLTIYVFAIFRNVPSEQHLIQFKEFLTTKQEHFKERKEVNRAYRSAKNKFKWIENNSSVISNIIQEVRPL